ECLCVVLGTIKVVLEEEGWCYEACRRFNKKVVPKSKVVDVEEIGEEVDDAHNTLWCKSGKQPANNVNQKFKVSVKVQDSNGITTFVLFDREDRNVDDFPNEVNHLINKRCIFRIEITHFNIKTGFSVLYNVQNLCDYDEIIQSVITKSKAQDDAQDQPETQSMTSAHILLKDALILRAKGVMAKKSHAIWDSPVSDTGRYARKAHFQTLASQIMVLQLTNFTSEITDEELREFTSEYYIPFALHPVVPAAIASIADFPEGKVGVYTRVHNGTCAGATRDGEYRCIAPTEPTAQCTRGAEREAGEVDSGLKRKRAPSDDGAGTSKRVRHVSLGGSTSIEEETPDAPPTLMLPTGESNVESLLLVGCLLFVRSVEATSDSSAPEGSWNMVPDAFEGIASGSAYVRSLAEAESSKSYAQKLCRGKKGTACQGKKFFSSLESGELLEKRRRTWSFAYAAMSAFESQDVNQSFGDLEVCIGHDMVSEAVEELLEKKLLIFLPGAQVPIFSCPRDIFNPFALEKEIPLKESLEAHAIRLAKKKGVKGKAILCGVGAAHITRSDGVPVSVATVSPKDSELLGKLEEAGDAAYQVGSSEQSRCHSI
ncbi:gypsy type transposase, partial [Tanacetum coccineum]